MLMKQKIRKAVFPVAGLGTRFLPATKVLAKEMLNVFNKPVIQYAVEEAMEAGIEEFIFITGRGKGIIEDHFDISYELQDHLDKKNKDSYKELITKGIPSAGKAFFTRQQYPKGLGHAVLCAKALVGLEPFIVILPDELLKTGSSCLKEMLNFYYNTDAKNVIATTRVAKEDISKYGILDIKDNIINQNGFVKISGLIEKPTQEKAPSDIAIIGRYILDNSIFAELEHTKEGFGGEIQLTDSINTLCATSPTYGYLYKDTRFDCGNPMGLLEASINIAIDVDKEKTLSLLKSILNKKN
jgi:UTP--glucose-1-phosphate uridylyltransferase